MSDFGMFEADEATQRAPQAQARLAARKMDAAIDVVRSRFGRFLLGATGIDEFGDRWHYSKHDIRAAVEPYVFPNTGTMRRLHNALKQDWKVAHPYKVGLSHDEAGFGSMPEGDGPPKNLDTDETYRPSGGNLIPKGDFEGYKDAVDQDGPEKVQAHDFTPGGDSGSDKHARRVQAGPKEDEWYDEDFYDDNEAYQKEKAKSQADDNKKEAARLVADIYTDFARANGLRVASLDTLDHYAATGIHEADYRLLQSMIIATAADDCECDDDEDDDSDSEASSASESDESGSDDSEGEAPDFGGDSDAEGESDEDDESDDSGASETENEDEDYGFGDEDGDGDHDDEDHHDGGGETYTVPEHAPELDPQMMQEIPQDDAGGSAPVPPEVIDSLLGLPEGTIEQLLLEEVEQGQGGAPQGGGDDFFGQGGDEPEPPRTARRRRVAKDYGRKCPECKSNNTDYSPSTNDYDCYDCGATFKPYSDSKKSPKKESRLHQARQFWAAEDDQQPQDDPAGGGQPPQGDPSQGGAPVDPSAMGGGMMPPPGSGAVAPPAPPQPLENQPAEDALLDTANQAIMQMIDRETQEYQQIIDPLSQALQAVQFAQQVEQSEHPMDVTPPQGTVDVSPSAAPGGQPPMQQQTARRRRTATPDRKGPWTDIVYAQGDDYNKMADMGPEEMFHHMKQWDYGDDDNVRDEAPWGTNDRLHSFTDGDLEYVVSEGDGGAGLVRRPINRQSRRQAKVDFALRNAAALIASRYRLSATGHQMLLEATLGRRGYEHVVEALRLVPPEVRKAAAIHMSHLFAAGNQRFNKDVFMKTVMAGTARERYQDKAYSGPRDKRRDEHGRQDLEDRDANHPMFWFQGEDPGPKPGPENPDHAYYHASRSRLPFELPRHLAGETLTPTPTMDAFEFPNAGETVRIDDNNDLNNLPVMKGADPHGKNANSQRAVDRFRRWQQRQQQMGLSTTEGESAVHNFLQTRNPVKKRVGPDAQNMIHRELGLQPDAVKTPKAKPVKAVNPTLKGKAGTTPKAPEAKPATPKAAPKTASFFTRKVPGWRWDDHLNGYLAKEARDFSCSCGQKVAAPSYKTCSCGKIWNVYAIGDTHHLASDTADMFIAREIPVRPGVVMANRKLASWRPCEYCNDTEAWGHERGCPHYLDSLEESLYNAPDMQFLNDQEKADLLEHLNKKNTKPEDYAWHNPNRISKKADRSHRELLAEIERLADWTKYDGPDPSRDPKVKPPTTKIPKQPQDWTNREFTGPDKGQWRDPDPTELPRKTRKKK